MAERKGGYGLEPETARRRATKANWPKADKSKKRHRRHWTNRGKTDPLSHTRINGHLSCQCRGQRATKASKAETLVLLLVYYANGGW